MLHRILLGEPGPMRTTEKKRVMGPARRRRSGLGIGKRSNGLANPLRKLRGTGLLRVDVDSYLERLRGR